MFDRRTLALALFGAITLTLPEARAEDPDPAAVLESTGHLGLRIAQDGRDIRMTPIGPPEPYQVVSVDLRAAPFEIMAPLRSWSAARPDAPLQIGVSDDDDFLALLETGRGAEETEFLGPSWYKAMAWNSARPGELLTAEERLFDIPTGMDYAHNWIADHRFTNAHPGYRTLLVTAIKRRRADESLLRSGAKVTMVFYLDRRLGDPPNTPSTLIAGQQDDLVEAREIDVVRFVFH